MNDRSKLIFRAGTAVALCAAVIAAVLYAISYTGFYDKTIRHFNESPTVTAFVVLFALSAVVLIITSVTFCRRGQLIEKAPNQIESFLLWLTAFMFLGFGLISLTGSNSVFYSLPAAKLTFGSVCAMASGPLALLSAFSFVCAVSDRLRGSTAHALSSYIPVLWGACLMFKYYFDLSEMPLNDPELSLTSVSISAMMIFFLSESRSALGINTPAVALFGNLAAAALTGCTSTARIILSITAGHDLPSLMENIIFFSVSALALTRIISFEHKVPEPVYTPTDMDSLYSDEKPEADTNEDDTL